MIICRHGYRQVAGDRSNELIVTLDPARFDTRKDGGIRYVVGLRGGIIGIGRVDVFIISVACPDTVRISPPLDDIGIRIVVEPLRRSAGQLGG